jgi:hypothetical protein
VSAGPFERFFDWFYDRIGDGFTAIAEGATAEARAKLAEKPINRNILGVSSTALALSNTPVVQRALGLRHLNWHRDEWRETTTFELTCDRCSRTYRTTIDELTLVAASSPTLELADQLGAAASRHAINCHGVARS